MSGLDDGVMREDEAFLASCMGAPQDKHEWLFLRAEQFDDSIGERLPTTLVMRACLPCTHGEGGIEQQHSLCGPMLEVAVFGRDEPEIGLHFLEDVAQ